MKQRIISLLLCFCLLAGLTVPASAAKTDNLSPQHTYHGQFKDVPRSEWYYENVKALYEFGLTNGQTSRDRFAPHADITLAEAITMAARLRSLYETGSSEAGPGTSVGSSWYSHYVAYARKMGIISAEFEGQYGVKATRAQMAHILAHALPASLFTSINEKAVTTGYASRSYIRDVTEYTPYQQDILTLYRWGILSGMDRLGTFHPAENVQRNEVAAMVTRLIRSDLRIKLDWDPSSTVSKAGTTYQDLVRSSGTFHSAPSATDSRAIDDNIRYMLAKGQRSMKLNYGRTPLSSEQINALLNAFLHGIRFYAEQSYNEITCVSSSNGIITLQFSCSLWDDKMLSAYRDATLEAAISVHDQLWKEGIITASMSQYDKARAYYTWLCSHCQYDNAATDTSASHSAYSAFTTGLAVCDGYVAAYNLLLKLEGIPCTTMSTKDNSHIWTIAELDGTSYHIDPTWGDQVNSVAYRYFAMTEAVSLARFP